MLQVRTPWDVTDVQDTAQVAVLVVVSVVLVAATTPVISLAEVIVKLQVESTNPTSKCRRCASLNKEAHLYWHIIQKEIQLMTVTCFQFEGRPISTKLLI